MPCRQALLGNTALSEIFFWEGLKCLWAVLKENIKIRYQKPLFMVSQGHLNEYTNQFPTVCDQVEENLEVASMCKLYWCTSIDTKSCGAKNLNFQM